MSLLGYVELACVVLITVASTIALIEVKKGNRLSGKRPFYAFLTVCLTLMGFAFMTFFDSHFDLLSSSLYLCMGVLITVIVRAAKPKYFRAIAP